MGLLVIDQQKQSVLPTNHFLKICNENYRQTSSPHKWTDWWQTHVYTQIDNTAITGLALILQNYSVIYSQTIYHKWWHTFTPHACKVGDDNVI